LIKYKKSIITLITSVLFKETSSEIAILIDEIITSHREKGKTFDQIAEWLNRKDTYLFVGRSSKEIIFIQS